MGRRCGIFGTPPEPATRASPPSPERPRAGAASRSWDRPRAESGTKNTLTVEMLSGTLESHSEDEVLSGFNRAFIGREVIGFRSAVLSETVPNTYTLSGLLRGLPTPRTTSAPMATMRTSRLLLNGGGIHLVEITPGEAWSRVQHQGRSGRRLDRRCRRAGGHDRRQEPPPVRARVNITTSRPVDDITASWTRRTREVCRYSARSRSPKHSSATRSRSRLMAAIPP